MGLGRALVGGVLGGTAGAALMLPLFAWAKRAGVLREAPLASPSRPAVRAASCWTRVA